MPQQTGMQRLRYIGTKTVVAQAMTRLAYNELRGWTLPADENGADEGYLVEYTDGGKPNHPDFEVYVSWLPKEQFDNAYRCADTFLDRLRIEQSDLQAKVIGLVNFRATPAFEALPPVQRALLSAQQSLMRSYLEVLDLRIENSIDSMSDAQLSAMPESMRLSLRGD